MQKHKKYVRGIANAQYLILAKRNDKKTILNMMSKIWEKKLQICGGKILYYSVQLKAPNFKLFGSRPMFSLTNWILAHFS